MHALLYVPPLLGDGMYAFLRVPAFLGGGIYIFRCPGAPRWHQFPGNCHNFQFLQLIIEEYPKAQI